MKKPTERYFSPLQEFLKRRFFSILVPARKMKQQTYINYCYAKKTTLNINKLNSLNHCFPPDVLLWFYCLAYLSPG